MESCSVEFLLQEECHKALNTPKTEFIRKEHPPGILLASERGCMLDSVSANFMQNFCSSHYYRKILQHHYRRFQCGCQCLC